MNEKTAQVMSEIFCIKVKTDDPDYPKMMKLAESWNSLSSELRNLIIQNVDSVIDGG